MSSSPAADDGRAAFQKARRAENAQLRELLDKAVVEIDDKLQELTQETAARLGMKASDVRAEFLLQVNARPTALPNPWNGLVHEKSVEWSDMKETHPGGAYMNYVVSRIHKEGLYQNLSKEERDRLTTVAQKSRDDRVNAGAAKMTAARLRQGSAKNELVDVGESIDRLHELAHIEYILLVTKGRVQDGLKPMYFASRKAKIFIESHLNVPTTHLLTLMESSVLRGAGGAADTNTLAIGEAKSELRRAMLTALQEAAVSTAEDGSPPVVADGSSVRAVGYKNYHKNIREYRVQAFGWPMRDDGSMMDPSSMGLAKMRELLTKISNKQCGFNRLTQNEWIEWNKQQNEEIAAGKATLSTRKTRSDAGKKRKNGGALDMAVLVDASKRKKMASKEKENEKAKSKRLKNASRGGDPPTEPCGDEPGSQGFPLDDPTPPFNTQELNPPTSGPGALVHPAPIDLALIDPTLLALNANATCATNATAPKGPYPGNIMSSASPVPQRHPVAPSSPHGLISSSRIASHSTNASTQPSLRFRSHTPESYESYASRGSTRSRPNTPTDNLVEKTASTRGGRSRSLRSIYADLG